MKRIISLLLALFLLLGAAFAEEDVETEDGELTLEALGTMLDMTTTVSRVISRPFYENVTDEESATEAMGSIAEELGADETTYLALDSIRPTETGLTYYTFYQVAAGNLPVTGGAAKLVVDADGTAVCAVGTLYPDMPDIDEDEWKITAGEAEEKIREIFAEDHLKVLEGLTHQTLLPCYNLTSAYAVWVVYTNNPWDDFDAPYIAHYVAAQGNYVDSVGVSAPMSSGALSGSGAELVFSGLEAGTWTGKVTLFNGETREVTVPTLIDPETGEVVLGDLNRKIIVADYAEYAQNNTIEPFILEDGWDDGDILILEGFCKVWDFYNEIGWTGPDGEETPVLLLMNWVDEKGEPVRNACYYGRENGFQIFSFNRLERDGECIDTLAHEFTHCVTTALMTFNIYMNDTGAINEALSDIMGNLIEEYESENASPEWLIGEGAGDPNLILRNMSNPHEYQQPGYVWDRYYVASVSEATDNNDNGGVHGNSSLLNLIAWRLHEAGMPVNTEFDFWMNTIMAMTPGTDYPQMAELLPWMLQQLGMDEWLETLEAAIAETRIAEDTPEDIPEGCTLIFCEIPGDSGYDCSQFTLSLVDEDGTLGGVLWPDARFNLLLGVVASGTWQALMQTTDEDGNITNWVLAGGRWISDEDESALDEFDDEDLWIELEADDICELPTEGLF